MGRGKREKEERLGYIYRQKGIYIKAQKGERDNKRLYKSLQKINTINNPWSSHKKSQT